MKDLIFLISLIMLFILAKEQLSKNESGRKFIEALDKNINMAFKWRANSEVKKDLKSLSKLFGYLTAISIVVTLVLSILKIQPSFYYVISVILMIFIWSSLAWGTNTRKETLDWFKHIALLVVAPWLFFFFDFLIDNPNEKILTYFKVLVSHDFGIQLASSVEVAIFLSIILLIGSLLVSIWWFIQNSIIVSTVVLCIWGSIQISKGIIKLNSSAITFYAFFIYIICSIILYILT